MLRSFAVVLYENLRIAVQVLLANPMRAGLATLGIVIGLTTIILMVTIITGLNQTVANQIANIGSSTLYVDKFPWARNGNFREFRNRPDITLRDYEAVRDQARGVEHVAPTVFRNITVEYRGQTATRVGLVGTTEAYRETSNSLPDVGRFLTPLDVRHRRYVCLLGYEIVDALFEGESPIGKSVTMAGTSFRVIGILERQGQIFDFSMDNRVVIPIGTFFKVFGSHRTVQIEVKVASAALIDEVRDEVRGVLRRRRGLGPRDDDDFAINHQEALLAIYREMTSRVYAGGIGISAIALLVGGIGIMNIMLVSVTERTREIGVRKALGARRSVILGQFLLEAILVCFGGGLAGVTLAWALTRLISSVTPLPTAMPAWIVVFGVLFSSTVGLVFGLMPAVRAARLAPVDALRYE